MTFARVPPQFLGSASAASANTKLKLAGIGIGGRGTRDIERFSTENADTVIIAASDHIHSPAAIRAMRLAEQVYCDKPMDQGTSRKR